MYRISTERPSGDLVQHCQAMSFAGGCPAGTQSFRSKLGYTQASPSTPAGWEHWAAVSAGVLSQHVTPVGAESVGDGDSGDAGALAELRAEPEDDEPSGRTGPSGLAARAGSASRRSSHQEPRATTPRRRNTARSSAPLRPRTRGDTDGGFDPAAGSDGIPAPGVTRGSSRLGRCFTNETNCGLAVPPDTSAVVGDPQWVQNASP